MSSPENAPKTDAEPLQKPARKTGLPGERPRRPAEPRPHDPRPHEPRPHEPRPQEPKPAGRKALEQALLEAGKDLEDLTRPRGPGAA
ncbi:hypothetical protein GCM10022224_038250 [Nonomuraea antimicrobica]|uniref:Uncharacterized protein n=1 Tax=Nonomuraea antimicrobica TaxID=561173 RepID=A0ABP7BWN3_9ACTN